MTCSDRCGRLLYYETVKLVHIQSRKLGAIHYGIQILILIYIIVWVIVLNKGYQKFDAAVGNVSVKMKGNAYYLNATNYPIIWDAVDLVVPPVERDAVFITTTVLETLGQTRQVAPGDDPVTEACSSYPNNQCTPLTPTANGVTTGTCSNNTWCDIYTWYPLENDTASNYNQMIGVDGNTVFMRSDVEFPYYQVTRNNAIGTAPQKLVNLFTVGQIVSQAPINTSANWTYPQVQLNGTLIAALVQWNCNFDFNVDYCLPTFRFIRLDDPSSFSSGFNFRYARYFENPEGVLTRDLFKVYGIRVVFLLTGSAGKFNIIPLLQNIGSGLALLAIATLVSDFVALNCLPNRKFYHKVKYVDVNDDVDEAIQSDGEVTQVRRNGSPSEKEPLNKQSQQMYNNS